MPHCKRLDFAMRPAVKKNNFLTGAVILSAGGIIAKIIGAVYRIPLTNLFGSRGMGLYQLIFPFYTLLLAASSAGIPAAISRLIAERLKLNDFKGSVKIFKTAFFSLGAAGLFFSAALYFFSDVIAAVQGNPQLAGGYRMIAPSVFFVSQISVLRGYFQGRMNMVFTAVSQIIEQVVKAALTLTVAVSFLPDIIGAVKYSVLAVTISEAAALVFLAAMYLAGRKKYNTGYVQGAKAGEIGTFKAAFMVFAISVPITIGSIILPLSQIIDSALAVNIIGRYSENAVSLYGIFSGPVNSLAGVPVLVTSAIAAAAIPAISAGRISGENEGIKNKVNFVLKLAFLIGLICGAVFLLFSKEIIGVLYPNFSAGEIATASNLLKISSFSVLFLSLMQVTVAVLVALKRAAVSTINLIIAVIVKIALNYMLLNIPALNIYGAALSAALCYFTASFLNTLYISKFPQGKLNFYATVLRPFKCAVFTLIPLYFLYLAANLYFSANVSFLIAALFFAPIFLYTALKTNVFTDYEIKLIPVIKKMRLNKASA